ncbi:MAG: hypothetical protein IRY95_03840, partial [Clostridia bacterium]|nr:hypothetical protein [Clostridia bacterium]
GTAIGLYVYFRLILVMFRRGGEAVVPPAGSERAGAGREEGGRRPSTGVAAQVAVAVAVAVAAAATLQWGMAPPAVTLLAQFLPQLP